MAIVLHNCKLRLFLCLLPLHHKQLLPVWVLHMLLVLRHDFFIRLFWCWGSLVELDGCIDEVALPVPFSLLVTTTTLLFSLTALVFWHHVCNFSDIIVGIPAWHLFSTGFIPRSSYCCTSGCILFANAFHLLILGTLKSFFLTFGASTFEGKSRIKLVSTTALLPSLLLMIASLGFWVGRISGMWSTIVILKSWNLICASFVRMACPLFLHLLVLIHL